jgi:hypothetical protein
VPPSFALTASGYIGTPVVLASTRYVFVPARQFVGVRVASVRLPAQRNPAIFAHTIRTTSFHVSGGVLHNVGPTPERIARVAGHRIDPVPVAKAGVRPVSLTESGVAQGRRLAVVAPKAERAAAISKPSEAAHARPNRNVERSHVTNARPAESPRQPGAVKARPVKAVSKPAQPERAAAKAEKTASKPTNPAKKPEKSVAKNPPAEKPRPEAVGHEAPPPEHVAAARPAPKPQAAQPRPRPQPKKTNAPKPHPHEPNPQPKNDGSGN